MIARLPQLERLDGKEITRTGRMKAQQRLPALREEIIPLAQEVRVVPFVRRAYIFIIPSPPIPFSVRCVVVLLVLLLVSTSPGW